MRQKHPAPTPVEQQAYRDAAEGLVNMVEALPRIRDAALWGELVVPKK